MSREWMTRNVFIWSIGECDLLQLLYTFVVCQKYVVDDSWVLGVKSSKILLQQLYVDHRLQIKHRSFIFPQSFISQLDAMGHTISHLKETAFVTGADLDPPGLHEKKKSYNPQKRASIDYSTYGPKKWWKESTSEEELAQHLNKLQKKEKILQKFKHHKDFDRIEYQRMYDQATIFQCFLEESLCSARLMSVQFATDYFTVGVWRKLFIPFSLCLLPVGLCRIMSSQEYHIINHDYFRMTPNELALYAQYDQKLNLFKYVDDYKYNFKYHSLRDYYKTRRFVHQSCRNAKWNWYKQMWQYDMGLKTEPLQEFAKLRQSKRKGNWNILTQEEKQQIEKQLKLRDNQSI